MTDAVHIDDLATPRFSAEAQQMVDAMASVAEWCPLDADVLHQRASADTGLTDFGSQDYRERLDVLLEAFGELPGMTPAGRTYAFSLLTMFLKARLRIVDHLTHHPEILGVEVPAPLIIAGLPRTGTTHLHSLLAADPTKRALPYWEAQEPLPQPGEVGIEARRERTGVALDLSNTLMPYFPLMHEMTIDHIHEDIGLLAYNFTSGFFETLTHMPRWSRYYKSHDQTSSYEFLRVMLKILQNQRGSNHWVLKAPSHLEQFPVLAKVFPDATFIITHRDPVDVAVSMATMMSYCMRMTVEKVDVPLVANFWVDRIDDLLSACIRDRHVLPADRSIDVKFDEFMADDMGTVRRIWDVAGYRPTAKSEKAVTDYLSSHTRNRLGRVDYRPEDLGLDKDELRKRFAPYVERFVD